MELGGELREGGHPERVGGIGFGDIWGGGLWGWAFGGTGNGGRLRGGTSICFRGVFGAGSLGVNPGGQQGWGVTGEGGIPRRGEFGVGGGGGSGGHQVGEGDGGPLRFGDVWQRWGGGQGECRWVLGGHIMKVGGNGVWGHFGVGVLSGGGGESGAGRGLWGGLWRRGVLEGELGSLGLSGGLRGGTPGRWGGFGVWGGGEGSEGLG